MSFGLFESNSRTRSTVNNTDRKLIASDQAVLQQQTGGVGSGATYLRAGGNLHIDSTPSVLLASLDTVRTQARDYQESLSEILAANTKAQRDAAITASDEKRSLVNATFSNLAKLAENQQTGGEAGRSKIVLWASAAALLAVVAVVVWGKR